MNAPQQPRHTYAPGAYVGPAQHFPPAPPAPTAKSPKPRRWPWALGVVAAFLFGVGIGNSGDSPAPAAVASAPNPTPLALAPAYEPEPVETLAPAAPAGTVTNGTYEIGTEVAPGKYKSAGPESGLVSLCYVDVQRDEEFLAQEVSNDGQVRIEIKESWKGALLEVSGCQPLVKQ